MNEEFENELDDLRPEYDFANMTGGVRGKYVDRLSETQREGYRSGTNVVLLEPDRLEHYRKCLENFLLEYADYGTKRSGLETQVILDITNDHYLLFRTGWDNNRRIHACIFHFDIKDGKIWIQENNTDLEIDRDLEEMGISKKELVIGFHHPSMREHSEYAIA